METDASAAIDMMRYGPQALPATMEFLFIELLLAMKAAGKAHFSLGMVPFAGLPGEPEAKQLDHSSAEAVSGKRLP